MSRQKKSAYTLKSNVSKEWLNKRKAEEENLKGNNEFLYDEPTSLDKLGLHYYIFLVQELEATNLLCNVDKPSLEQTADCLSKMQQAREILNTEGIMITSEDRYGNEMKKEHPMVKTILAYSQRYSALANSLGLDPASRASLASKKVEANEESNDPVLTLLKKRQERENKYAD